MSRAQSHIIGIAIMLAVTVIAIGAILGAVGAVFQAQASSVDVTRVADGFDRALQPTRTTGFRTATVSFSDGGLRTSTRQIRVSRNGSVTRTIDADALVFTAEDRRVASVGGAIIRGTPGNAWLLRSPPIVASNDTVAIGVVALNASDTAVSGAGTTYLRTNVSHSRSNLGRGTFSIHLETATPGPLVNYFADLNTSIRRVDHDGDGITSVVATFTGTRTGYLVTHDLRLEVDDG
ncbi:MAG: type IV pilin [Salinirussus sp.]